MTLEKEAESDSDLEFPPGVKLLQALDCLLSVHHGGHRGALLWGDKEREKEAENKSIRRRRRRAALTLTGLCGQEAVGDNLLIL